MNLNHLSLEYSPMKIKCSLLLCALFFVVGFSMPWPFSMLLQPRTPSYQSTAHPSWLNQSMSTIHSQASNLNMQVLQLRLKAYLKAKNTLHATDILTIIDYSKPSTE